MRMKKILLICTLAGICACKSVKQTATVKDHTLSLMPEAPAWGALWQQKAAEYRALSYQAYNSARQALDEFLKQSSGKPKTIVTDIDETILDNSPYYVHQAEKHANYSDSSWLIWTRQVACDTVPGAPSFFQYAASKGVTVFYITNRISGDKVQTIENLKKHNFPNADEAHLMLMDKESSKEARRQGVAKDYDIIMLLGDNLGDFAALFDNDSMKDRYNWTESNRKAFGTRFIVLPNNMYGNWEEAYYQGQNPRSFADSNAVLNKLMRTYP